MPSGATFLLCLLLCSQARAAERPLVAVDLSALSPPLALRLDALALEQRVIQRLLQEGFALVSPHAEPDVLLGIEPAGEGLRLVARSGGGEEGVVLVLGHGTRSELQLEISQRLADLARAQVAAVEQARPLPAAVPPPRPRPFRHVPVEVPGPPPPRGVEVAFSVGAEALWRAEVDAQLKLQLELRARTLFVLLASAAFARSVAPGLAVDEWQAQAGVGVRFLEVGRISARAGLQAGVSSHRFRFAAVEAREPEGGRLDLLVSAPLELLYRPAGPLEVGVRLTPGLASRAREHLRDGRPIWSREAARLESGAFCGLAF